MGGAVDVFASEPCGTFRGCFVAGLTDQQHVEFAALRRALRDGDHEMVAASFDILQSLETPVLPMLEELGRSIWDEEDDDSRLEALLAGIVEGLDAPAIPAMATYLMEEEGPDLLLDLVADRLQEFNEKTLLRGLRGALRSSDERLREGARDYLDEMAMDSEAAEALLDEFEETE